jgi:hypothetical protein
MEDIYHLLDISTDIHYMSFLHLAYIGFGGTHLPLLGHGVPPGHIWGGFIFGLHCTIGPAGGGPDLQV